MVAKNQEQVSGETCSIDYVFSSAEKIPKKIT